MNLERLYFILKESTFPIRKGDSVVHSEIDGIPVTEIFNMPSEPTFDDNNFFEVDCIFLAIAVDKKKADEHKEELIEILKTYPEPERLAGGPSYIEVGGILGDQGAAFQLFALGKYLGLWEIITPKSFFIEGKQVLELAGMGLIMISGFKGGK